MNKAGFIGRFIAFALDMIIAGILAWVLALALSAVLGITADSDSGLIGLLRSAILIVFVPAIVFFQFLYFGFFWSRTGQSLGMWLPGIRVVRRNQEARPSFLRAGLRGSVGYWISGLLFGLGFIWAAFDANKEAWHDKLFDTWVVTK